MRHRRKITALLLFGGLLMMTFALAQPASAEVIEGPCIGDAVFSNGTVVTERTPLSVNNAVPAEDTVEYFGDTTLSDPAEPEDADFVVVNTCGFIESARDESLGAIDEMLDLKRQGKIRGVVVTGCLAERQQGKLGSKIKTKLVAGMDTSMLDARCESCGTCVAYCPTGALDDRALPRRRAKRPAR